jgi:hypothetical protein
MSPDQHELSQQLYGNRQQSIGAMDAVKEAFKEFRDAMYPGLTWDKISGDIGQELKHQVSAGAHELAAALYTGHAFVMYPRDANARDDHGIHGPEQTHDNRMEQEAPSQHLERGGRGM